MIGLPEILDVPDKLRPVITELDKKRYFLLDGGRGSGKSHTVARLILYLCGQHTLRVVCGREIQSSIEESVYTLLCDLIREHNLDYNIYATKIDHRSNGSTIRFHGFREQGNVTIKGLEAVDILWVDEAQAVPKPTLDIIIPTIRAENAKVFWTMNRYLDDDPVYTMFHSREDCLSIHIDYHESKHCPDALKREAELCKSTNLDDYQHIWLGQPLPQANNAAFRRVREIVKPYVIPVTYSKEYQYVMGVDLARSIDYTVLTIINATIKRVDYVERLANENRTSWNYQKEKVLAVSGIYGNALTVVDSTGVGDPIVEDLLRSGCNVYFNQTDSGKETSGVKFTSTSKDNLVEKLKVAIENKLITIPDDKDLIRELERFECFTLPSGNHRWQARDGEHDDMVMSLALAVWGARDFIYQPRYEPPKKVTRTDEFWKHVKDDIARNTGEDEEIMLTEAVEA